MKYHSCNYSSSNFEDNKGQPKDPVAFFYEEFKEYAPI